MRKLPFFLLLFLPHILFSQVSSSNIFGVIKSKSGQKISQARVQIFYKSKGIRYNTYTDMNGIYRFYYIETGGPYTLKVEHYQFLPYEKRNLEFELGENTIDITIEEKKNSF